MPNFRKNKYIITGLTGTGKSYMALDLALKNRGTTIICNSCARKKYDHVNCDIIITLPYIYEMFDLSYNRIGIL